MPSLIQLSNVGESQNVHIVICALASTFGMTASAGSAASGAGLADCDGAVLGASLAAVDACAWLAGAGDAVDCEQAEMASSAAINSVMCRFLVSISSSCVLR